jgi:hypothetical protein
LGVIWFAAFRQTGHEETKIKNPASKKQEWGQRSFVHNTAACAMMGSQEKSSCPPVN